MSKNLTRKGLALGAVVALGSTLFAGTPANAAESISLASAAGTSTKTILGSSFELVSTFAGWSVAPTNLAVSVTGAEDAELGVGVAASATKTTAISTAETAALAAAGDGTVETDPVAISFDAQTLETPVLGQYYVTSIFLDDAVVEDTKTVTVTLFNDNVVTNGQIDDGEVKSSTVTLTFVKPSAVVPTVTLVKPTTADVAIDLKTTLGDINVQQIDAGLVETVLVENGIDSGAIAAAYDADSAALLSSHIGLTITSSDRFNAYAKVKDLGVITTTKRGSNAGLVGPAASAFEIVSISDPEAVSAENVKSDGVTIRAGVKSFNIESTVEVENSNAVAIKSAGVPVRVTIAGGATLGAGKSLSAGGKTINATTASASFEVTTNASGKIVVPVSTTGAADATGFTVKVEALDKSTGAYVDNAANAAVAFAFSTATDATGFLGYNGYQAQYSVVKGGSITLPITIWDSFGKVETAKYRATVTETVATTSGANITQQVVFTGSGNVTIADNSTSTGTITVDVALEEWDATNSNWSGVVTAASVADIVINVVSEAQVATTLTAELGDSAGVLEADDFSAVNENTGAAIGQTAIETLTGSVYDANGAVVPGAPVTISGKGLLFTDASVLGNAKVSALDSITVYTNSSGSYGVGYFSHKTGVTAITVKSGSATKNIDSAEFAASVLNADIATATLTGGTSVLPSGRTVMFSVKLLDKWGNSVASDDQKVSVSYDGPGYLVKDDHTVTAGGKLSLRLITNAGDAGLGELTVKLSGVGNAALPGTGTDLEDNITLTKSFVVGISASVSGGKKLATATVKNAAGLTIKVVSGSKTVTKVATSDSYKVSLKKLTAGKKTIKVYVGDILVSSKKVTVKK